MKQNVSQHISHWLKSQGITKVFCVTGGGAMFLNHALSEANGFDVTYMHHEQACAMAAEGYARVSGKPAIVNVTTGPGGINALNGVYGAFTDSIPMIILSGQVKRQTLLSSYPNLSLRQLGDQEAPIIKMVKPITKFSQLIISETELEHALPEAYHMSVFGRGGPVWLDIPIDIQSSTTVLNFKNLPILPEIQASDTDIDAVIEQLKHAKCPLILAGTGVRLSGAIEALLNFAELHKIPISTAWTHDIIASSHPLFVGRPGTIGTRSANLILQQCDVLVCIGSRLNVRQSGYNFQDFAKNACKIQIDIDEAELNKPTLQCDLRIVSDAKAFLDALTAKCEAQPLPSYDAWLKWCQNIKQTYPALEFKSHDQTLNPYLVIDEIFKHLKGEEIIVCGNASACIIPFQIGQIKAGQRLFSNSGSASMGYDLPAAIGAAKANPQGRVICFAGDGSLQMNVQELETLKHIRQSFVLFVIENNGYLSIKQSHENFFGQVLGSTPQTGVSFPDYCKLAQAYGLKTQIIQNEADLAKIPAVLENNEPLVCVLKVDESCGFVPRIKSRVGADGKLESPQLDDMFPFLEADELEKIRKSAPR